MEMRKKIGVLSLLLLLTIVVCVLLSACGDWFSSRSGEEIQDDLIVGEDNIVFVDGGGTEICTVTKTDLANTVKSYRGLANLENVYTWSCTIDTGSGAQEFVVVRDDKLEVETIQSLLNKSITKIEIYPSSYYTLLTYDNKEYKAVLGDIPTAITPATKPYHTFEGYFATIDGNEVRITDKTGAFSDIWEYRMRSLALTARFSKQEIALVIDYNGGDYTQDDEEAGRGALSGSITAPKMIKIDDDLNFLVKRISREGFTFDGWYSGKLKVMDGEDLSFYNKTNRLNEDFDIVEGENGGYTLLLTAHWTREEVHVLFFKTDGKTTEETVAEKTIPYGSPIIFDGIALKDEYKYGIVTWRYADGALYREGDLALVKDTILVAYVDWKSISLELDYKGGDYTQADEDAGIGMLNKTLSAPKTMKIGDSLSFLTEEISREGFTFAGWYSCDLQVVDADFALKEKMSVLSGIFDIEEGEKDEYLLKLTARWVRKQVTLTFKKTVEDGSDPETICTKTLQYGDSISFDGIVLPDLGFGNYVWTYSDGSEYKSGDIVPPKDDVLTASFVKTDIQLFFNYNGGEYTAEDAEAGLGALHMEGTVPNKICVGDSLSFLTAPISRDGFTFDGWYCGNRRVVDDAFNLYTGVFPLTFAEEGADGSYTASFIARWIRKDVSVSFKKKVGDNVSTLYAFVRKYGADIPFDEIGSAYRKEKMLWKDESGRTYKNGDTVPAEPLTLYLFLNYSIEYTGLMGASNEANDTVYTLQNDVTLRQPSDRPGYRFLYWRLGDNVIEEITSEDYQSIYGDSTTVTLEAVWLVIPIEVKIYGVDEVAFDSGAENESVLLDTLYYCYGNEEIAEGYYEEEAFINKVDAISYAYDHFTIKGCYGQMVNNGCPVGEEETSASYDLEYFSATGAPTSLKPERNISIYAYCCPNEYTVSGTSENGKVYWSASPVTTSDGSTSLTNVLYGATVYWRLTADVGYDNPSEYYGSAVLNKEGFLFEDSVATKALTACVAHKYTVSGASENGAVYWSLAELTLSDGAESLPDVEYGTTVYWRIAATVGYEEPIPSYGSVILNNENFVLDSSTATKALPSCTLREYIVTGVSENGTVYWSTAAITNAGGSPSLAELVYGDTVYWRIAADVGYDLPENYYGSAVLSTADFKLSGSNAIKTVSACHAREYTVSGAVENGTVYWATSAISTFGGSLSLEHVSYGSTIYWRIAANVGYEADPPYGSMTLISEKFALTDSEATTLFTPCTLQEYTVTGTSENGIVYWSTSPITVSGGESSLQKIAYGTQLYWRIAANVGYDAPDVCYGSSTLDGEDFKLDASEAKKPMAACTAREYTVSGSSANGTVYWSLSSISSSGGSISLSAAYGSTVYWRIEANTGYTKPYTYYGSITLNSGYFVLENSTATRTMSSCSAKKYATVSGTSSNGTVYWSFYAIYSTGGSTSLTNVTYGNTIYWRIAADTGYDEPEVYYGSVVFNESNFVLSESTATKVMSGCTAHEYTVSGTSSNGTVYWSASEIKTSGGSASLTNVPYGSTVYWRIAADTGYIMPSTYYGSLVLTKGHFTISDSKATKAMSACTASQYTVSYNANGGTGTTESSTHTYDTAKKLTKNGFSRTGYVFAGWGTSANGSAVYGNEESVKNLSLTGAGVTLYAQWTQIVCNAKIVESTFKANLYCESTDMGVATFTVQGIKVKYNGAYYVYGNAWFSGTLNGDFGAVAGFHLKSISQEILMGGVFHWKGADNNNGSRGVAGWIKSEGCNTKTNVTYFAEDPGKNFIGKSAPVSISITDICVKMSSQTAEAELTPAPEIATTTMQTTIRGERNNNSMETGRLTFDIMGIKVKYNGSYYIMGNAYYEGNPQGSRLNDVYDLYLRNCNRKVLFGGTLLWRGSYGDNSESGACTFNKNDGYDITTIRYMMEDPSKDFAGNESVIVSISGICVQLGDVDDYAYAAPSIGTSSFKASFYCNRYSTIATDEYSGKGTFSVIGIEVSYNGETYLYGNAFYSGTPGTTALGDIGRFSLRDLTKAVLLGGTMQWYGTNGNVNECAIMAFDRGRTVSETWVAYMQEDGAKDFCANKDHELSITGICVKK